MMIPSVQNCVNVTWENSFLVGLLNVLRGMHVIPELPFTAMRRRFTKLTGELVSAIPDHLFAQNHLKVLKPHLVNKQILLQNI